MFRRLLLFGMSAVLGSPVVGLAQSANVDEAKDPRIARTYALYAPGGGYLYTKEYVRAAAAMGLTVIGVYNLTEELGCQIASNSLLGADTGCSGAKKLLWLGLSIAPYVYGIVDAPKSASRANQRNGHRPTQVFIQPGVERTVVLGLTRAF
jgi:hypothetical protein